MRTLHTSVDRLTERLTHSSTCLPIEIILNVLCQVHIKHDKVVEVTSREGLAGKLASHAAAPLAWTAHGIQTDLRRGFHMQQN